MHTKFGGQRVNLPNFASCEVLLSLAGLCSTFNIAFTRYPLQALAWAPSLIAFLHHIQFAKLCRSCKKC
jgi:hypothetical protein